MRTAVIRVTVDTTGQLSAEQLRAAGASLAAAAAGAGIDVTSISERELRVQVGASDAATARETVAALCARAYGSAPVLGSVTFLSRGTDEDAHGVLAQFGLAGRISRTDSGSGFDIVTVRVAIDELSRIPESRVLTALEAALNCEVRLVAS
ncbi:hypothetical protein [Nocardia alni]|uniref:hypothetical protein n=1 Tax=Nocardia alni TaxID=2815723 RepID=UPI001C210FCD|nr:hypothetical protein [Nocardia alni]